LKLFLILFLLPAAAFAQQQAPERTCRILFLDGPNSAPATLQLFDGSKCREVDLPRMNFSKIYQLPGGPLNLRLLPAPPDDPTKIPPEAPGVAVAEGITDFYLLVSSDPANTIAPVRMQVINAGADKLKPGQTLWFNLTQNPVGGTLGSETLRIQPGARAVLNAPTTGSSDYPVKLFYCVIGDERLYPLCQTKWRHDPRCRCVAFIINANGRRCPRVMTFSDFREPPPKKTP